MDEGDTLVIAAGYYEFEDGLSLDVNNVTIKGDGMDKTILDFKSQKSGAQGLLVTSDKVTLKDFAILDAKGDALKVCLLYTSPSPRDDATSRMPSSA